jgi:4-hydroxy-3-methylbut-2-enyl diphosphate reductase
LVEEEAAKGEPITLVGKLVHNDRVIERLAEQGVRTVRDASDLRGETAVISAHGAPPERRAAIAQLGGRVLDATCPFVTRVHSAAKQYLREGRQVLIVGDPGHPEVEGILGIVGGEAIVVRGEEEVAQLNLRSRVGIVSQTTQRSADFERIVAAVKRLVPDVAAINTVCGATDDLQAAARDLAEEVSVVIVVGGCESANSNRLRQTCEEMGARAYLVGEPEGIRSQWLDGADAIGLTAGASTPQWLVEEVLNRLEILVSGSGEAERRASPRRRTRSC